MGWNSWDSFGTTVTEDEVKANADYMAAHLKAHGWQYVVVDIQWSEPNPKSHGYRPNAELVMDEYGRLMPAPNRFPSAAERQGLQAAGRLRSRAGPEVRHPHHARHSAARRGCQPAGLRQPAQGRRDREQGVHLSLEHRHVRRRCQQAGRTGLLRFDRQPVRVLGRRLHQGRRHVRQWSRRRPQRGDRRPQPVPPRVRPAHRAEPLARDA